MKYEKFSSGFRQIRAVCKEAYGGEFLSCYKFASIDITNRRPRLRVWCNLTILSNNNFLKSFSKNLSFGVDFKL